MAKRTLALVGSALLYCSTATSAYSAEILDNGGFELPKVLSPCCNTAPPDSVTDWTVLTGNVNVVNGTFSSTNGNLAKEGTQYLDLVGQGGVGSISQTFATVAGQLYNFSFAYSHNLFAGLASASAAYSVGGLTGTVTHTGGDTNDLAWVVFTDTFVGTGDLMTLTFTNLTGGPNEGIFLDAVSIAAVPEPEMWAMLLFGFGAIGFQMRRRNKLRMVTA